MGFTESASTPLDVSSVKVEPFFVLPKEDGFPSGQ